MSSMIINRKTVRFFRAPHREGRGQAWVCARDFLLAAGAATPRSLVGDFLADHLGAEAVQTLKTKAPDGTIIRLIFVHAEVCHRLLQLFSGRQVNTVASLALKGLSMTLSIKFEDGPEKVAARETPEVSTYDFNGMSLRVVQIDGEPWFVAADVRTALGLARGGSRSRMFGADETKRVSELNGVTLKGHGLLLLSESGLYKLITRSDKPEAKPFQEWVTRDVLPALRKHGTYSMTDGVEEQPTTETPPALVGEIIEPSRQQIIEASFTAMVRGRFEENLRVRERLERKLEELHTAIDNDRALLRLLPNAA